ARDFRDGGRESALMAARVIRGEKPSSIPFKLTARIRLIINRTEARANGLVIPASVLKRADELIDQSHGHHERALCRWFECDRQGAARWLLGRPPGQRIG